MLVPASTVVVTGQTDGNGNAQLISRMPERWSTGAAIVEAGLTLAACTTNGAVLVWCQLQIPHTLKVVIAAFGR